MLPIVTPAEMRAIDAAAPEPEEVLVERAGSAVARAAIRMMGGTYGRTVDVVAGIGNNGADGRVAARHLAARGVKVRVWPVATCPATLPAGDLVIDAAFGTGFHGSWRPPDVGDTPVLAVDLPSGLDGLTGTVDGRVLAATRTITFAALKPGLLLAHGPDLAGDIEVVDIGLDVDSATSLVQRDDVASWVPARASNAHKWNAAVRIIAGSRNMPGAAALCAGAAQRTGAGMVQVSVPGLDHAAQLPSYALCFLMTVGQFQHRSF